MMTTTTTKTTEYTVTFHWSAEAWVYENGESGEPPMTSSDPVTVTLPSDATPWQVYSEADAIDKGPDKNPDVSGWYDDGMTIEYDGKCYSIDAFEISQDTQWSDFY